jgi:hypothetical protein
MSGRDFYIVFDFVSDTIGSAQMVNMVNTISAFFILNN